MKRSDKKRALRAASVIPSKTTRTMSAYLRADAGEPGQAKWSMLFPKGTFHNGGWPEEGVTIDDAFCAAMVANWNKRGNPSLPIDYLHRGGEEGLSVDQQIASGWIEGLEARADGLWAQIKWTDKARALIAADEYRYLSPEWHPDGRDARTGLPQGPTLIGAGLLNRPAFQEMPRVAAAAVVAPPTPNPAVEETIMTKKQMLALLAKFGVTAVTDASTDAEVLAAVEKLDATATAEALKASAATADALKAAQAALTTKDGETAKLTASVSSLQASVDEMKKRELAVATDALCARLISEHRIVAAAQDSVKKLVASIGIEEASKFYDTFPKNQIAPAGERGHGAEVETDDSKAVKAAAVELVEKKGLTGSAAIRAAAMGNANVVKKLGTLAKN